MRMICMFVLVTLTAAQAVGQKPMTSNPAGDPLISGTPASGEKKLPPVKTESVLAGTTAGPVYVTVPKVEMHLHYNGTAPRSYNGRRGVYRGMTLKQLSNELDKRHLTPEGIQAATVAALDSEAGQASVVKALNSPAGQEAMVSAMKSQDGQIALGGAMVAALKSEAGKAAIREAMTPAAPKKAAAATTSGGWPTWLKWGIGLLLAGGVVWLLVRGYQEFQRQQAAGQGGASAAGGAGP